MAQKIILDTDIGDDIDDAYALSLVLRSEELELVGVTTVFGNTVARARQARTILTITGNENIPVAAGCGAVMSPRLAFGEKDLTSGGLPVLKPAYDLLEDVKPRQDGTCLNEKELPPLDPRHGVDFLIEEILKGDGDIIPVTIGAMTNLAMALVKKPEIRTKIPRIVSMAAAFDRLKSEWNIMCDPVAAAIVFDSAIPMTVAGLDVTTKCQFNDDDLEKLHSAPGPLAQNLSAATKAWNAKGYPRLHDPLAVETIFRPDIVTTEKGKVMVDLCGDITYGFTILKRDESGPHDVCVDVKAREAIDLWFERVVG